MTKAELIAEVRAALAEFDKEGSPFDRISLIEAGTQLQIRLEDMLENAEQPTE